jgi:Rod binding domain-containing protein
MDTGISSSVDLTGADLAASSWTLPRSANGAISPNETFRDALENASGNQDTPEKIAGVAKQFEALMIGQMLKSARESSGGGWLDDEDGQDDQTGSLVMEMAEQGFSQALAERGGLGIARMVTASLEHREAKTPSSDSALPSPAQGPTGTAPNKASTR